MPPELIATVANWGLPAFILVIILYRVDQAIQSLLPVIIKHFTKLDEGFDTMKAFLDTLKQQTGVLTRLTERVDEVGGSLSEDHASIAEDAKHAHHHARRAADGVEEILRVIPQRLVDKEVS